jgi:hypothetical protein
MRRPIAALKKVVVIAQRMETTRERREGNVS